MDYNRQPCPWRIFYDTGMSFALGSIGGGLFSAVRGYFNAPSGVLRRLNGSIDAIKLRAPITAGSFACWGLAFSACDCSLAHLRGKEDPWNAVLSGAVSGGVMSARNGLPGIISGALVGALILGLLEGVNIGLNHVTAEQFQPKSPHEN